MIKSGRTIGVLLICLLLTAVTGFSKNPQTIRTSLLGEQIGLPDFRGYGPGAGIGLSAGTEFYYCKGKHVDFLQTADVSFINHPQYGSSFIFSSLAGIRPHAGKFSFDLKAGPGYLIFHNYTPTYRNENGTYKKTSGIQHKLAATVSLGASYQIKNLQPYIAYSMMVESPFIRSSSPILPHRMLELGFYIHITPHNNEK